MRITGSFFFNWSAKKIDFLCLPNQSPERTVSKLSPWMKICVEGRLDSEIEIMGEEMQECCIKGGKWVIRYLSE